jgi:hypothetical protein
LTPAGLQTPKTARSLREARSGEPMKLSEGTPVTSDL